MSRPAQSAKVRMSEAQRQRELIAAIFSPQVPDVPCADTRQSGVRWQAGIAAYRGNGRTHARNALRVQFPTVLAMLGDDTFDALCAHYWRTCPPARGDLAWVGEALPACIEAMENFSEWPWLADCARLDWAVWQLAGAAPASFSEADLHRLIDGDPAALFLQLSPAVRRLPSAWPIVMLFDAHHQPPPDWGAVTRAIAEGCTQTAWIWRPHGNLAATPRVMSIDAAADRWVAALASGMALDCALDAAGETFDFAAWLEQAVAQGWLDGVVDKQAHADLPRRSPP